MKTILIALMALLIFQSPVFASAKMVIGEGENVVLNAESDLISPDFKWVLMINDTIVDTQTSPQFQYIFQQAGEYRLNLSVSSKRNTETENTYAEILVGKTYKFTDSLVVNLQTFPEIQNNKIFVAENGFVSFVLNQSGGDIQEYHIDADVQKDTDGDGELSNDIDNAQDRSYTDGSIWSYRYAIEDLPTQAHISVFDKDGLSDTQTFSVLALNESAQEAVKKKSVLAVLNSAPSVQEDKRVHLQGDTQTVSLFSGSSHGNVIEYRIDTDINEDSDGDGNTSNDIDNLDHPSFHSGEVFEVELKRVFGEKIMQLIVVTQEGKGSKIQKKFVWDNDKVLALQNEFRLVSEKTNGFVGDMFYFSLDGAPITDDYEIKWDFNGDQKTDITSSEKLVSYQYDTIGEYEVLVQIKNENKALLKYAKLAVEIQEKPIEETLTQAPISNFTYEITDDGVEFEDTSTVDPELQDKKLQYQWDFGDDSESTEKHPDYVYKENGEFIVKLTVTDSAGLSHTKQEIVKVTNIISSDTEESEVVPEEVIVEEEEEVVDLPVPKKETKKEDTKSSEDSGSALMTFVYILIGLIGFILLGGIAYLFILKVKNPDYTFSEIIEEEKEKILSSLEGRSYDPPHGEILEAGKDIKSAAQGILNDSEQAEEIRKDLQEEKKEAAPEVIKEEVKEKPVPENNVEEKVEEIKPEPVVQAAPKVQEAEKPKPASAQAPVEVKPTPQPQQAQVQQTAPQPQQAAPKPVQNQSQNPSAAPVPEAQKNPAPQAPVANAPEPKKQDIKEQLDDDDIPDWLK